MKIQDIIDAAAGDWSQVIKLIAELNPYDTEIPNLNQDLYDAKHSVLQLPPKNVKGKAQEVNKLVVNFQKKIADSAVAFAIGKGIKISDNSDVADEVFEQFNKMLKLANFQNSVYKCALKQVIQTRTAKIFYIKNPEDREKRKLGIMNLDYRNGLFYPNFDNGVMDSFLRLYNTQQIVDGKLKDVESFYLYTDAVDYQGIKLGDNWTVTQSINEFGKIPVVFYEQKYSEWHDVETLIDRFEKSFSGHADVNDYFASPIVLLYGNVTGMPDKNDSGKVLQIEGTTDSEGKFTQGKVEYLEWNHRPESLKMEHESLINFIYSITSTPNLSFDNLLQNKLGNISGVALRTMLLDSFIKASKMQNQYNENLQRELSICKEAYRLLSLSGNAEDLDFGISYNSVLPENVAETVDYLIQATGGEKVLSQSTAVSLNPLTQNTVEEMKTINTEQGIAIGSNDI